MGKSSHFTCFLIKQFLPLPSIIPILQTLLFQKDIDFKLSVMIISEYNNERKVEVLNELDKRIECVKFNFSEKIEKFLDAACLQHLRYIEKYIVRLYV